MKYIDSPIYQEKKKSILKIYFDNIIIQEKKKKFLNYKEKKRINEILKVYKSIFPKRCTSSSKL
jgi:hypothetical protein